jgi:hypothetical protein
LKLQAELKRVETLNDSLSQSAANSEAFAVEVSRKAEKLVNNLQAISDGGDMPVLNGQSVSAMILESAKNLQLVNAMSGQFSEEHTLSQLRYVMDQNVDLQLRKGELDYQIKAMSQQVEDSSSEIATLKMALELTSDDRSRKKTRRGKGKSLPVG